MKCCVCDKEVNILNSLKTANGERVCKKCTSIIPEDFEANVDRLESSEVSKMVLWFKENLPKMRNSYQETSRFENIGLDAVSGLVLIGKTDVAGRPTKDSSIYDLKTLCGIAPSMNVVSQSPGLVKVKTNVIFSFDYPSQYRVNVSFKDADTYGQEEGAMIKFGLPYNISIFLEELLETANNAQTKASSAAFEIAKKAEEEAVLRARGLFLMDNDEIIMSELKKRRNELIKAFHPDNGGLPEYAAAVSDGYKILSKIAK